jgi:hypothetical protein
VSWQSLLQEVPQHQTMPWVGGRQLFDRKRRYKLEGPLPPEHGWHRFEVGGTRRAVWSGPSDPDPDYDQGRETVRGFLVGDRLVPDGAAVIPDPDRLTDQAVAVHLVERGLDRFARGVAAREPGGPWVFVRVEFPLGPEPEVAAAYADRLGTVTHLAGVPPALDLAFRVCQRQRELAEEARREAEARRVEEAREEEIRRRVGTGAGRRELAAIDFAGAARASLALSGAELLDERPARARGERTVQFRFRNRRFECVVDEQSLRVIDAGICLVDHRTGERGDTRFTLESLPGVIAEAMNDGKLVVFRHVG